jgi:lysophospholipase L1-like esterase
MTRYTTQATSIQIDNGGKGGEAVSARATTDSPTALMRYEGLLPGHGAVLIMEGTNDLQMAHGAANQAAADDILARAYAGLRQMLIDAKASGIRPFLATIPPMNPTGSRGQLYGWELVPAFNDRVTMIAGLEQVTLVDINKAFGGNLALLGADGVHPNADGYKKIADTFFAAIQNTLEVKTTSTSLAPAIRRRR